jgi:hypothetical protein
VVDPLPGGGAEGDIAHEADGAVGEAFTDIENATVRMVWAEIGALIRRIVRVLQVNGGRSAIEAGAITEPLVPLTIEVEAVGSEGVTEGADRVPFGIIAADRPEGLVFVGVVGAEINNAPGTERTVDGA